MLTVGIDLGGTFVDGYFADDDRWMTCKVPTLRFDLTRSVVACIGAGADAFGEPLEGFLERIDLLRLSTTVGTNAIVEGKGSRVGLVVTSGQERTLYGAEPPTALFDTFIDPDFVRGATLPSEAEEILTSCRSLIDLGVRRVVISYPRGASSEERATRQAVQDRYPEHYLRSVPLQLGSEISACTEDDVRTATAVVNAYLHRDMAQLLHSTEQELRSKGMRSSLLVVHANSGVARASKTTAISTYSSGPAAGLSAAERLSIRNNDPVVLTADMGGTTLDLGLVRDGRCEVEVRPTIAGVRVALPMNRTASVGCAGCSDRFGQGRLAEDRAGERRGGSRPGGLRDGRRGAYPDRCRCGDRVARRWEGLRRAVRTRRRPSAGCDRRSGVTTEVLRRRSCHPDRAASRGGPRLRFVVLPRAPADRSYRCHPLRVRRCGTGAYAGSCKRCRHPAPPNVPVWLGIQRLRMHGGRCPSSLRGVRRSWAQCRSLGSGDREAPTGERPGRHPCRAFRARARRRGSACGREGRDRPCLVGAAAGAQADGDG